METMSALKIRLKRIADVRTSRGKGPIEVVASSLDEQRKPKTFKEHSLEILIMCRVCTMLRKVLKGFRELEVKGVPGRDQDLVLLEKKEGKMDIDHTLFNSRQDRFPRKAELITLKKSEWRTQEEAKFLCSLLQILPSYQSYSNHLQLLLAMVLRFERFGRRRVVIKKGHRGSSFYFIYSGRVAVCNDEDGSSAFVAQEPTLLQKGAIFGDIALIKGQRRNATVVCMEETEFLVVDKEDFFAHKLDVELEKEFRYRFDFFRSLDIFSHCPAKHIENISEICQTMIFYHGQLVIPDTSESSSITFVTEGSCELLMLVNLTNCPSYHKYLQRQMALHLTNPSPTQQPRPICTNRFKSIMLNSRPLLEPNYERPTLHRPTVKDRCKKMQRDSLAFPLIVTAEHSDVEKTRSRIRWAEAFVSEHRDVSKAPARTFEDIQKAVAAAVYLRIDLLHQGEFVGLNEYLLTESQRDTRSKVLVSKGTKTILLKKEQFERFCDAKTLEKLQRYQRSYPSDDDLCQLFLEKNDWKIFKKDLVASVLQPLASTQAQKKKMKKVTTNFQRAGILDLCSISPNSQQGKSQEERRLIVIPTHGREGYLKPPDTSLRLIHGIAVPRRPKLKGLIG